MRSMLTLIPAILLAFPMMAAAESESDLAQAFPFKSCTRHMPRHKPDRIGFDYDPREGTLMINWGPGGKNRYYDYNLQDPSTRAWIGRQYARFIHEVVIRPGRGSVYTIVYDLVIKGNRGSFTVTRTSHNPGYPDKVLVEPVALTNCR